MPFRYTCSLSLPLRYAVYAAMPFSFFRHDAIDFHAAFFFDIDAFRHAVAFAAAIMLRDATITFR